MRTIFRKHPPEGQLRAYLDQELASSQQEQTANHLDVCTACQQRLEALQQRAVQVGAVMLPRELPEAGQFRPVGVARARLETYPSEKEVGVMSRSFFARKRPLVIAAALIAVIALSFAFPQVRALASDFLGLFRVEQIALVPFDPSNLAAQTAGNQLGNMLSENAIYEEIGEVTEVASAEEAAALAGIPVRLPTEVGDHGEPQLSVGSGIHVEMTVDLPRVRAILQEAGYTEIELADNIDQAAIVVEIPRAVIAEYGDCQIIQRDPNNASRYGSISSPCLTLIQFASPTVEAPSNIDMQALGQAYLELTGMPKRDAEVFSQRINWATTFVLPIPNNAEFTEWNVDGTKGMYIYQSYGSQMYSLLWVREGVVYLMTGPTSQNHLARPAANSLR